MNIQPLHEQQVTAHYDGDERVVYVIYFGILGPDASTAAYEWLENLINTIGVDAIRGEIFDFTGVTQFRPDNLINAKKSSRMLNLRTNVDNMPVAMVVKDMVQEEILRGPMRNVPENPRKRIVHSEEEAFAFFDEWHAQRDT